ncbi:MAG TPA: glycosyltransferase [Xanthobacteraceae bacterium]|jgi:hypothetical protein
MLPITLVSASRQRETEFYSNSALGKSLSQTYPDFPVKKQIFFENARPLPVCYNEALREAENPDEILVFMHDDVYLVDFFWLDKLYWGFQNFHVLGVAGNKRRVPKQPNWAFIDEQFTWDYPFNLTGVVGHGRQFPCQLTSYGRPGQECKLMDGVLLSVKKSTLDKHGIQFDERFDFHFYDLDLCRQAEQHHVRMGTVPLALIHESGGQFGTPQWKENYWKYLEKWRE